MTRRRAAIVIVVVTVALMSWLLAPAREQLAWWWAESRNTAADYKDYLEQWPNGRHSSQADAYYRQRDWEQTKAAMISAAYKEVAKPNAAADAAYIREKKLRHENFYWKAVSTENTLEGFRDYLRQYPRGKHAAEARRQIDLLSPQASNQP